MALLDDEAVDEALRDLRWERGGDQIVKTHRAKGFPEAIVFVNSVAALAEAANHHPDIDIRWNVVVLHLSTHSEGGITQADVKLARAIDALG